MKTRRATWKQCPVVAASILLGFMTTAGFSGATAQAAVLTPADVTPGAALVITGEKFGTYRSPQANRVLVNGVPALIQRWEPDRIELRVPYRAESGPVEIIQGGKTSVAGTVTIQRPVIEALEPAELEAGGSLRIVGKGFGPTGGSKDPNVMFGVNDVLVGGVPVRADRWADNAVELKLPANARSGPVSVRLASFDPLPDGSCCAPVEYVVSNALPVSLIPTVRVDPMAGPPGTKVVLFGQGFGSTRGAEDGVLIAGEPAIVAQWKDDLIVAHVPLRTRSGALVLKTHGRERALGEFTVHAPQATAISPTSAPIGTLLRISGQHFGYYSESGATPYSFMDFNKGDNRVEIGGVPAVIYRWHDDRIDVWVPFSAKSGKVVVYRSANRPRPDGTCCAERGVVAAEAGDFTVVTPVIESYSPQSAGLDATVTIKGKGFGTFLKTAEHTELGLSQKAYKRRTDVEINESGSESTVISNVSRTEVLFNGAAALVKSWTDSEIVVTVPRRNLYGIGKRGEFFDNLARGPLVVRRGSWDVLPDGTCCSTKQWLTVEAGPFTIEAQDLPDTGYWNHNRPDASTNQ